MILEIDIWRSANLMMQQHGDLADIEAATRADEMLAKGDIDGQRMWMRILRAIDVLRTIEPGEKVN
jgi:hypothetical protein